MMGFSIIGFKWRDARSAFTDIRWSHLNWVSFYAGFYAAREVNKKLKEEPNE